MVGMVQCLVSYFGFTADEQRRPLRYYSYQVIGGPGPAKGSGVASITLLAAGDPHEIYQIYQNFHVVHQGGAAAAIEKAIRYLDSFHSGDRLRQVRTEVARQSSFAFPPNDRTGTPPLPTQAFGRGQISLQAQSRCGRGGSDGIQQH
ncbi:MAG TPA: hypothetical protein VMG10_24035 [Gemmataceae bacterium]|nr:hypothetical protein [Gemmataceae bacterium]